MPQAPPSADVVVVGAGISGLIATAFLARRGRRTVLLEANHQAGGLMAGIRRKGFYFDCGDQSFEDAGLLFPLLEQLGIDPRERMHRCSHRVLSREVDYLITSLDDVEAAIRPAVPEDADGLRRLFDRLRRLEKAQRGAADRIFPSAVAPAEAPAATRRFVTWMLRHGPAFRRAAQQRFEDVVCEHIEDDALRQLLGRTGYRDQSLLMAAGLWQSWCHDYWYPRGGMQAFVDEIAQKCRDAGAEVFFHEPVTDVVESSGRVTGVRTAGGSTIMAPRVVWCADAKTLYGRVLPEEFRDSPEARRILAGTPSDPMVALYLGLELEPDRLREILGASHLFHCHDNVIHRTEDRLADPDVHRDTWLQWSAPILHGEPFAPEGQSAVVLHAFTDVHWMDRWGAGKGKAAYRAVKKRVADHMLSVAEQLIPDIRERIVYQDLGTPLSTIRFTGNSDGATCGWTYGITGRPFGAPGIQPSTPLEGLYHGGHWAIWPGGVPFAALSGKIAAELAMDGWMGHLWRLITGR